MMDTLAHLGMGFGVALQPTNLLVAAIGSFLGTVVGLLPGLGPINGVAPAPLTNAAFTAALAHAVHRPALLPMPAFALNVAFGEMSGMLMASQRVMPRRALESGYAFAHPGLDGALRALLEPAASAVAA